MAEKEHSEKVLDTALGIAREEHNAQLRNVDSLDQKASILIALLPLSISALLGVVSLPKNNEGLSVVIIAPIVGLALAVILAAISFSPKKWKTIQTGEGKESISSLHNLSCDYDNYVIACLNAYSTCIEKNAETVERKASWLQRSLMALIAGLSISLIWIIK